MAKSNKSQNASSESRKGELENIREILFGNQARETEDRLFQLEEDLQKMQRDLTESLSKQTSNLREATVVAEKELSIQINNQATIVESNHHALEESLSQLRADSKRNLDELQAQLSQNMEAMRSSLSEQIRRMQTESRQRDDDLRQELLSMSTWLDNKLTPRQDLGQMLMELGQQLQDDAETSSDEKQND